MTSSDMQNWCCSYNHVFYNPFRLGVMIDVCLRQLTLDTKTDLVGVGHSYEPSSSCQCWRPLQYDNNPASKRCAEVASLSQG